jgi:sRNA-binding regulator protein Hfq
MIRRGNGGDRRESGTRPPGRRPPPSDATGQEAQYLQTCQERAEAVTVHLLDGSTVCGVLTGYDAAVLEITTDSGASMVLRKEDVAMLEESGDRSGTA